MNKSDALTVCLEELTLKKVNIDVICISEHFIMSGYEDYLSIPNYELAACFSRKDIKRGGTCILVKKGLQWVDLPDINKLAISNSFECCAIKLTQTGTIVICIYRIPKSNNLTTFFERLEKLLQSITKQRKQNIIICGDFNIDTLKGSNISLDLKCLLLNYNLKLELNQPTRLKSNTCIDNFAHNLGNKCKADVVEFALSDHTGQILKCPVKRTFCLNYWYIKRRDFSTENMKKFRECLENTSFSDIYECDDPDRA